MVPRVRPSDRYIASFERIFLPGKRYIYFISPMLISMLPRKYSLSPFLSIFRLSFEEKKKEKKKKERKNKLRCIGKLQRGC